MGLVRVLWPTGDVVTLEETKRQAAVEHTDHDTLIQTMIDACVDNVDGPRGVLGRALLDQTWDFYLDAFPAGACGQVKAIELPLPPLIEVVGVFYQGSAGAEQEWDAANYIVSNSGDQPAKITPASSWPTAKKIADAVRIQIRCGYLDNSSPPVAAVPEAIRQAILLNVATLYKNRETYVVGDTVAKLPWAAEQLLRPHRVNLGIA